MSVIELLKTNQSITEDHPKTVVLNFDYEWSLVDVD